MPPAEVEPGGGVRAATLEVADHSPRTAVAEQAVREKLGKAAEKATNAPGLLLRVDRGHASGAQRRLRQQGGESRLYRVFIIDGELAIENHFSEGSALAVLNGKFMGSAATVVRATFQPETSGPDFDIDVRIEDTPMQ